MNVQVPRGLLIAAAAMLVYVLAVLVPMGAAVRSAEGRADGARQAWNDVQTKLPEYQRLQQTQPPPAPAPQQLVAALRNAAQAAGITAEQAGDLKDIGGNAAELKFTNVPGDAAVRFLYKVQALGLKINQMQMDSFSMDGIWTMKMVVATP